MRPSISLIEIHDEPEPPSGTDLILGEDGRVHLGEVVRRFHGTSCHANCDTYGKRPLGPLETWWSAAAWRFCQACGVTAETPFDNTRTM